MRKSARDAKRKKSKPMDLTLDEVLSSLKDTDKKIQEFIQDQATEDSKRKKKPPTSKKSPRS